MAKERGWWKIDYGDLRSEDLSDADKQHIAKCIIEGCVEGEICKDEDDE